MTSVYSKNLQITNAQQFKRSVESITEPYYYLCFGKVSPWPDDNNPPQADASIHSFNDVWKELIGAKIIQGNDVRLGIRRFDWSTGQTYPEYSDCACSQNMNNPNYNFYVVTDEWNVYKCISNNYGALSTSKPTSTITNTTTKLEDNYVWKYMYTLSDEDRMRFTTDKYIPVKTLTEDNGTLQWLVQNTAVQGSISQIKITSNGSNYTIAPTITVVGDGTSANAFATINSTTKVVESITLVDAGKDYTFANVAIEGVGTGATAEVVLSPRGGHGSNPEEELGASFVILNPRIKGTEGNILDVANEFRQVSIIKNPTLRGTKTLASAQALSQTTTVYLSIGTTEYYEDELVYQGPNLEEATFKGRVASWDSQNRILELVDISGNLTTDPLTGYESRSSRFVENSIARDLEPYTGSLIYINNISPIQRSSDQTEDFKIIISF